MNIELFTLLSIKRAVFSVIALLFVIVVELALPRDAAAHPVDAEGDLEYATAELSSAKENLKRANTSLLNFKQDLERLAEALSAASEMELFIAQEEYNRVNAQLRLAQHDVLDAKIYVKFFEMKILESEAYIISRESGGIISSPEATQAWTLVGWVSIQLDSLANAWETSQNDLGYY